MRFLQLGALAMLALAVTQQAHACSCVRETSVTEQAARYELIFVGTASETVGIGSEQSKPSIWRRLKFWDPVPTKRTPVFIGTVPLETRFQNPAVLKGSATSSVIIHHTEPDGANCGASFQAGQEYLVLAYQRDDGAYSTNICSWPQFSRAEFEAALTQAD